MSSGVGTMAFTRMATSAGSDGEREVIKNEIIDIPIRIGIRKMSRFRISRSIGSLSPYLAFLKNMSSNGISYCDTLNPTPESEVR